MSSFKIQIDPSSSHRIRRNRLPTGKKWIDNGLLLSDEHARMMKRIYPKSILAYSALGDEDVVAMVKSWVIPSQNSLS